MQPNYPQPMTPSSLQPKKKGSLFLPFIGVLLLLVGVTGFALWSYGGMTSYKNDVDKKIATATEVAKQQAATEKDKEFAEKQKSPFKSYHGPATYGGIEIQYPKTWSAYIEEKDSNPINGYLYPDYIPGLQSTTAFALRLVVENSSYDTVAQKYEGQIKAGKIKATPYKLQNVPSVNGLRLDGEVNVGQKVSMVILPLRDKTIEISTESTDNYLKDFENILSTMTFSP